MVLVVSVLLVIMGLGIIFFWVQHIATGGLPQGVRTLESDGYIAFHVTAETLTGITCILGGLAFAMGLGWGVPVALVAAGMLAYTGINSLAWKGSRSSPLLALVFTAAILVAFLSIGYLLVSYPSH